MLDKAITVDDRPPLYNVWIIRNIQVNIDISHQDDRTRKRGHTLKNVGKIV